MSSATTSARDQVPFDETNPQHCRCILILTKRDGTLFDATSVLEKTSLKFASGWDTLIPWACYAILQWNQLSCYNQWMIYNVLHMVALRKLFYGRKPLL